MIKLYLSHTGDDLEAQQLWNFASCVTWRVLVPDHGFYLCPLQGKLSVQTLESGKKWKSLSHVLSLWLTGLVSRPAGFSVHGILQARVLEWVAIPFSRRSSWPWDWTQVSYIASRLFTLWATREGQPLGHQGISAGSKIWHQCIPGRYAGKLSNCPSDQQNIIFN